MFVETHTDIPPVRRAPIGPAARLREAVLRLAGDGCEISRHHEKPWASITFEGARHTIELRFAGLAGIAAGENLIAALPDHEFAIPGQIVADVAITALDHVMVPAPGLSVTCELLLLKDA